MSVYLTKRPPTPDISSAHLAAHTVMTVLLAVLPASHPRDGFVTARLSSWHLLHFFLFLDQLSLLILVSRLLSFSLPTAESHVHPCFPSTRFHRWFCIRFPSPPVFLPHGWQSSQEHICLAPRIGSCQQTRKGWGTGTWREASWDIWDTRDSYIHILIADMVSIFSSPIWEPEARDPVPRASPHGHGWCVQLVKRRE